MNENMENIFQDYFIQESVPNFLNEYLKFLKSDAEVNALQNYLPLLRSLEHNIDPSSEDSNILETINECYQIIFSCIVTDSSYFPTEVEGMYLEMLFLLSMIKLKLITEDNIEFKDTIINTLNSGWNFIKFCYKYNMLMRSSYYSDKCFQIIEKVFSLNYEIEEPLRKFLEDRKITLKLHGIECMSKSDNLNECKEMLLLMKQEISNYTKLSEHFLRLCYNVSVKYAKSEQYSNSLELLTFSNDILNTFDCSRESRFSFLRLLAITYLQCDPENSWQKCMDIFDEVCAEFPDMLSIAWKLKAALLSKDINIIQNVLKQARTLKDVSMEFVSELVRQLKEQGYVHLAAKTLSVFRHRFQENQILYLMAIELKIYFSTTSDKEACTLYEEALQQLKNRKVPVSTIYPLCKIVLSHISGEYSKGSFNECVMWYTKCLNLVEELGVKNNLYYYLQGKLCLCYIKMNDVNKAKENLLKMMNSVTTCAFHVYLIFQTAILAEDEKLLELALKKSECIDNGSFNQALLACLKYAHSSGKKIFMKKMVEILFERFLLMKRIQLPTQIFQCLIRLHLDNSDDNHEKIIFFMEKAYESLLHDHDDKSNKNAQWFSQVSWNLALKPNNSPIDTFQYFLLSCKFQKKEKSIPIRLKNSLMLAASAGLCAVRNWNEGYSKIIKSKEELVREVLGIITECKNLDNVTNSSITCLLFLYEFEIRLYIKDSSSDVILKRMIQNPQIDVSTLQNAAAIALECNRNDFKLIAMILKTAIHKEMEKIHSDYHTISKIYHNLLQVLFSFQDNTTHEDENLELCRDFCKMLEEEEVMQEYPKTEILWTMVKCWNCGILKLTAGIHTYAQQWCSLAMKFLSKLDGLKSLHEEKMQKLYAIYFPESNY